MKTVFELHFEKQIIIYIAERDCSANRKAELFYEFHRYGTTYYEELCDALFFLSCGEKEGTLYLTPAGKPYISSSSNSPEDLKLCSADELPVFINDLDDQLNFFINRFQNAKNCALRKGSKRYLYLNEHSAADNSLTILQKRG